ncbi:MAG: nicotinate-nicotinamide nucleotide adenylyltransferase, partial [Desulfovibrionaceae bacterium]
MNSRIGLLGGSFNPVHCGHLRMAVEAREALGLDRVELVCAPSPPHKPSRGLAAFEDRFALLRESLDGLDGLVPSDIEAGREGPSYTSDTLDEYARREPDAQLFFVLGLPSMYELHQWHEGLGLPGKTNLAALRRGAAEPAGLPEYLATHWPGVICLGEGVWEFPGGRRLYLLDAPVLEISGT